MIRHIAALLVIFVTAVNTLSYSVSTVSASTSHHQTQDAENDSEAETDSENEVDHEEYLPSFLKHSFFSSLLKISFSNLEIPLHSISLGFFGKPPRV